MDDDFANIPMRRFYIHNKTYGRQETRYYLRYALPVDLSVRNCRQGIQAIGRTFDYAICDGKEITKVCCGALGSYLSGRCFSEAVRDRDRIKIVFIDNRMLLSKKNNAAWQKGHAGVNLGMLHRVSLAVVKSEQTLKVGRKNSRLTGSVRDRCLQKMFQCMSKRAIARVFKSILRANKYHNENLDQTFGQVACKV
jgi:hypothetical protein